MSKQEPSRNEAQNAGGRVERGRLALGLGVMATVILVLVLAGLASAGYKGPVGPADSRGSIREPSAETVPDAAALDLNAAIQRAAEAIVWENFSLYRRISAMPWEFNPRQ